MTRACRTPFLTTILAKSLQRASPISCTAILPLSKLVFAVWLSLMKGLPEFLQQVQSQLKNPARLYTEQAIADNRGRLELFQNEVAEFVRTAGVSAGLRDEAEAARQSALAALEGYQRFLEQDLLPRSSGDWRLGADLFRKKFPLALQTTATPEALAAKARQAFQRARQELFTVAAALHGELFPGKPAAATGATPEAQSRLIRLVKDELSKDHPSANRTG